MPRWEGQWSTPLKGTPVDTSPYPWGARGAGGAGDLFPPKRRGETLMAPGRGAILDPSEV